MKRSEKDSSSWVIPLLYVRSRWYQLSLFLIIILSLFFRFYDYGQRWVLAADQAGFAIVAKYALESRQLPLLGPFSSAGPFQTGGEWYWLVMLGKFLVFPSIISPWVFMTLLSIVFVWGMIVVGTKLVSKEFGLLAGLLTALSTGQIIQSVNLTNQTPLMLCSLGAIYTAILFSKKQNAHILFWLGLFVGLAASIHLQGVAVGIIIIVTIITCRIRDLRGYGYLIGGLILPWIPVLLVDSHNGFYTVQNMLHYYLFNPEPIPFEALGRRWATFALVFVPSAWAYTIGGVPFVGYALLGLAGGIAIYKTYTRTIRKEWLILFLSLAGMIILLRYTRTPIFESYVVFMHPLILFISAWVIYQLFHIRKVVGILLLSIVVIGSIYKSSSEIPHQASLSRHSGVAKMRDVLRTTYPGETFSLYDMRYKTAEYSLPLTLYLYEDGLLSNDGRRIGIANYYEEDNPDTFPIKPLSNNAPKALLNLDSSTSAELIKEGWVSTDPAFMYNSVQYWFTKTD